MRLIVKEKIISLTGKYFIKDTNDSDVYEVKGSFSMPKKFRITDMQGKELIMIKKKFFRPNLFAKFTFFEGEKEILTAKRKFSFKPKWEMEGEAGTYTITGNIFEWDFTLLKDGQAVATVMKKITLYRDSYCVDYEDENELPVILGVTVMFDYVHHRHNNENRN